MNDQNDDDPAESLFEEGKKYDWRQDKSPAAATLARANFEQAASLGHTGAIRALGHMIFDGRGGDQDKEYGILVVGSAFRMGDKGALEEVEDMLESYTDMDPPPSYSVAVLEAGNNLRELRHRLDQVDEFMRALAYKQTKAGSGKYVQIR